MFSSSFSEEALPSLMLCFTHLATSSQLFPVLSTAVGQAPCICFLFTRSQLRSFVGCEVWPQAG